MSRDELLKTIDSFATGENAEQVANARAEIDGLYTAIDAANKIHADDTAKIEKLNKDNMSLYFRVTGQKADPEPEEHEEQRGIDWDTIMKDAMETEKDG